MGKFCTEAAAAQVRAKRGCGVIKLFLCRVLRDVIPPTPPGPEGSNGNG